MTVYNLEEYFTLIKAYNETEPGQRARLFRGRIEFAFHHTPNELTKKYLEPFIKREKPKHVQSQPAANSH